MIQGTREPLISALALVGCFGCDKHGMSLTPEAPVKRRLEVGATLSRHERGGSAMCAVPWYKAIQRPEMTHI
jgi:hypothetical protein